MDGAEPDVRGEFAAWTVIDLHADAIDPRGEIEIVLNHAFNRHWSPSAGSLYSNENGNITLRVPLAELVSEGVRLTFRDPASDLGLGVTFAAWKTWLAVTTVLGILGAALRPKRPASPDG